MCFCSFASLAEKKEIWTLEGEEAAAGGSWYSQEFSLSPGVYEVEVETAVKEGSQVSLSVESIEETVFRALLQNDISLREGTNRTTFSFFCHGRYGAGAFEGRSSPGGAGVSGSGAESMENGKGCKVSAVCRYLSVCPARQLSPFCKKDTGGGNNGSRTGCGMDSGSSGDSGDSALSGGFCQ